MPLLPAALTCLRPPLQMETRKRLAKIVLVLVGLFAVCWFPNHVLYLYRSFHYQQLDLSLAHLVVTLLARVLSFSSSCVNPFALYLLSETFRRHFDRYRPSARHSPPLCANRKLVDQSEEPVCYRMTRCSSDRKLNSLLFFFFFFLFFSSSSAVSCAVVEVPAPSARSATCTAPPTSASPPLRRPRPLPLSSPRQTTGIPAGRRWLCEVGRGQSGWGSACPPGPSPTIQSESSSWKHKHWNLLTLNN